MTTALYRRYRPETFAEVIGQEHVTAPLMQALRSGRVNHAYLFSGPRGCGKTTSARILARTLNCARNTPENPIDTPCGECDSCVELARGGPGSLDVVEIDAASHNGVDDARDLRERATFAPARDRYKIFILDEAHMVTPQGFNALLKIVEEPPPHIKFVFATTEPDKVIGTIRSRTHHYPFRLVPPDVLGPYLEQLCAAEGVELGGGVVSLVTRAGGGSVRDTLSVLDQLMAGATGGILEYDTAVGLLGFTHATLLDDVVDALAARDGASIFRVVDQIIATGHEPRRFVEDVLERLRDLIVIAVSGDAAEAVLRGLPADQLERMRAQASHLGVAELSRAADLVNAALTEMTGATSPRLHLELLCARLLLPGADDGTQGLAARLDRLERGVVTAGGATAGSVPSPAAPSTGSPVFGSGDDPAVPQTAAAQSGGGLSGAAAARAALQASRRPSAAPAEPVVIASVAATTADAAHVPTSTPAPAPVVPAAPAEEPLGEPVSPADDAPSADDAPTADAESVGAEPVVDTEPAVDVEPAADDAPTADAESFGVEPAVDVEPAAEPEAAAPSELAPSGVAEGAVTTETVRRRWDEVVANLGNQVTRALVGPNAQVVTLEGGVLRLGFAAAGLARTFSQPRHIGAVEESLYQTLGVRAQVEAVVSEDGGASGGPGPGPAAPPTGPSIPDVPPPSDHDPRAVPDAPSRAGRGQASDRRVPAEQAGQAGGRGGPGRSEGWPDVAAPGGGPGASPRPTSGPASGTATMQTPATSGGVALAERPTAPAQLGAGADDADAAWLAGAPVTEPSVAEPPVTEPPVTEPPVTEPPDIEGAPEPPPAPWEAEEQTPAPAVASVPAATGTQAAPTAGSTASGRPRGVPETPRQAAERQVRESQARAQAAPVAPPSDDQFAEYDESTDDDSGPAPSGLTGVPLVVKMLGGTVIDEVADQP